MVLKLFMMINYIFKSLYFNLNLTEILIYQLKMHFKIHVGNFDPAWLFY